MNKEKFDRKIIIVDDEWQSPILRSVKRRLDEEGWQTKVVVPEGLMISGDDFEVEAMFAIESESPDAVLLDVRFGEHREDRGKRRKEVEVMVFLGSFSDFHLKTF